MFLRAGLGHVGVPESAGHMDVPQSGVRALGYPRERGQGLWMSPRVGSGHVGVSESGVRARGCLRELGQGTWVSLRAGSGHVDVPVSGVVLSSVGSTRTGGCLGCEDAGFNYPYFLNKMV